MAATTYASPLSYLFRNPPPRRGLGISGLPAPADDSLYTSSPDNGQEVNESYRLLFPGNAEQQYARKVEGFRKCQWAYSQNHSYSGCVDLITNTVMTNGLTPGSKPWRLVPALDDEDNPIKNPDKGQLAPFLAFSKNCNKNDVFNALLKQMVSDLTKADACFGEVSLTKIKGPLGYGQPGGLSLLDQASMRVRVDEHGDLAADYPFYQVRDKKPSIDFSWPQVLLLKNDGARGKGYLPQTPADKIEVPIHTSIEAEAFIRSYFTSGAKMGLIFENKTWTKGKADNFLRNIKADWTDSKRGHQPFMLYDGTTIHEPPSTIHEFAEFIAVQQYDVRKICSIFGMDSRIISSPGEGNLGGKGEREAIWNEFLLRCVNPRKLSISEQITHQILLLGFGITDWRFELVQFRDAKDAASKQAEANTYKIMSDSGLINNMRLSDINVARNAINPDFEDILPEELADMPGRVVRGNVANDPQDPNQVDAQGQPIPVGKKPAPAPVTPPAPEPAPAPAADSRTAGPRAPRPNEKRAPRKVYRKHHDDWVDTTIGAIWPMLRATIEKGAANYERAFESDRKIKAMEEANALPGSGEVGAAMARLFKDHFAGAKALCEKELEFHASTLDAPPTKTGKRNSDQLADEGPGGMADFIGSLGRSRFGKMYNQIVDKMKDLFRQAFREGSSTKQFVDLLASKVPGYAEKELTKIVRTSSTDLMTQARLQAGAESDITAGYEISGIDDDRECKCCRKLDGLQFPASKKFKHPPYHDQCRCTVNYILNGEDIEYDGAKYENAILGIQDGFGGES